MMKLTVVGAIAALVLLSWTPCAFSQGDRDQQCAEIYRKLDPGMEVAPGTGLLMLSGYIWDRITLPKFALDDMVSPRDMQSRAAGPSGASEALGQSEAVPTVQPMALAGGSLGAVGTDEGSGAITSVTVNPSMFLTDPNSVKDASYSRLTDLTISFPVDDLDRNDDGSIDYYAVRARINITGIRKGNRLLTHAEETFGELLNTDAEILAIVKKVLQESPNLEPCVEALLRQPIPDDEELTNVCQMNVRLAMNDEDYQKFKEQLAELREEADASYFGADVRFEDGDPTLGAVDTASGTALTAGLAAGRRITGKKAGDPTIGVKARLGVRHISLDYNDVNKFAIDGGIGFDMERSLDQGSVGVAGGIEFRYGGPEELEELLKTNFTILRFSVAVPFAQGVGLSLNYSTPIDGKTESILSVNANWELLLPTR